MSKNIITTFLLLKFLTAQDVIIPISADYAIYQLNDSSAWVEVYCSFFQGNLTYNPLNSNDTLKAEFNTRLSLYKNDNLFTNTLHKYSNTVTDTAKLHRFNLFSDVFAQALPFGEYKAVVRLTDETSKNNGEYELNLNIEKPGDNFYLSDIQLASEIKKDSGKSIFTKNGLKVIPNARRTFDLIQPMLYYYVELNNLSVKKDIKTYYSIFYSVTDENGAVIRESSKRRKEIISPIQVEIGGFNVMGLEHGLYNLNIHAVDSVSGTETLSRKRFFVNKPYRKQEIAQEAKLPSIDPVYDVFTIEELDNEFSVARYITTSDEEKIFANMDSLESKKLFLTEFWRKRDQKNNIQNGEYRSRYLALANEADKRFSSIFTKGWKTDRGRILMTYGAPSEIERFPNSVDRLPYIIWRYYNLEGGTDFVFWDPDGFRQYKLIHSTYHKELSNPDWRRIIMKNTSGNFDEF